jgi:DNA-binding transcriptional ArsR family regulator
VGDAADSDRDAAGEGEVFKALAGPTRRKILDELAERDGQTLFEICSRLAMEYRLGSSRQAVSQHLEVLVGAGLVTGHREGRYKFHYIDTGPLQRLTDRWRNRETKED